MMQSRIRMRSEQRLAVLETEAVERHAVLHGHGIAADFAEAAHDLVEPLVLTPALVTPAHVPAARCCLTADDAALLIMAFAAMSVDVKATRTNAAAHAQRPGKG